MGHLQPKLRHAVGVLAVLAGVLPVAAAQEARVREYSATSPGNNKSSEVSVDDTANTFRMPASTIAETNWKMYWNNVANDATGFSVMLGSSDPAGCITLGTNVQSALNAIEAHICALSPIPLPANPTGVVNGTVANGVLATYMRSDAAPPLADPFTPADGTQDFSGNVSAERAQFSDLTSLHDVVLSVFSGHSAAEDFAAVIDATGGFGGGLSILNNDGDAINANGGAFTVDASGLVNGGTLSGNNSGDVSLAASADSILALSSQQLSLDTQAANLGWFGPTSGAAATPTFRALVTADMPASVALNSFATMNVPAGTDPVADGPSDTLNWTNVNVTLTGDSSTDTIAVTLNDPIVPADGEQDITGGLNASGHVTAGDGLTSTYAELSSYIEVAGVATFDSEAIFGDGMQVEAIRNLDGIDAMTISPGDPAVVTFPGGIYLDTIAVSEILNADNFLAMTITSGAIPDVVVESELRTAFISDYAGDLMVTLGTALTPNVQVDSDMSVGTDLWCGSFLTTLGNPAFSIASGANPITTFVGEVHSDSTPSTTLGGAFRAFRDNSSAVLEASTFRDTSDPSGVLTLRGARGTEAAPAIIQSADRFGYVMGTPWDGNSYNLSASIEFYMDGTPGDGDTPSRIRMYTTPDGSATRVEALNIRQDKSTNVLGALNVTGIGTFLSSLSATGTISGSNLSSSGGANPSAQVNGTATNGSAITFMRSDGAPALANPLTPAGGLTDQGVSGNVSITASDSSTDYGGSVSGTEVANLSGSSETGGGSQVSVTRSGILNTTVSSSTSNVYGVNSSVAHQMTTTDGTGSRTTTKNVYGVAGSASSTGTATNVGSESRTVYGLYGTGTNTGTGVAGSTRTTYGAYAVATGDSQGASTAYGIFADASGADTNWAGYFDGPTHVDSLDSSGGIVGTSGAFSGAITGQSIAVSRTSVTAFSADSDNAPTTAQTGGTNTSGLYSGTFSSSGAIDTTVSSATSNTSGLDVSVTQSSTTTDSSSRTTTKNVYGANVSATSTGTATNTTGDTRTVYGLNSAATNTGTGVATSTRTTYGANLSATGDSQGASTAYGVYAAATGADTNWAGYFSGNVNVTGNLTLGGSATAFSTGPLAWKDWSAAAACGTGNYGAALGWASQSSGTYISSAIAGTYILFPIQYQAGTVVTRVRLKWQGAGATDGIQFDIVKRDESGTTTAYTLEGSLQSPATSASVTVTTYDVGDFTMSADTSYSIRVNSVVSAASSTRLYSVGVETSSRTY